MLPARLTPESWMRHLLSSREVGKGGVLRRQVHDVERLVGRARFLDEMRGRGFQVVENGRHFVIFCNRHPIRRVL